MNCDRCGEPAADVDQPKTFIIDAPDGRKSATQVLCADCIQHYLSHCWYEPLKKGERE